MEKNMFKNAKYGDRYETRIGEKATFVNFSEDGKNADVLVEGYKLRTVRIDGSYNQDGKPSDSDIVRCLEPTVTAMPHDGITAAGMIEELKKYPSDALVVVEYCNPTKMTYDAAANIIKID